MFGTGSDREVDTIVIGAGQAGLATGYHLARRGQEIALLDASKAVGASWRDRWDSLRLFTPVGFDSLPGLPFPGPRREHPTKDQVADYLAGYAQRFALPVMLDTRVQAVRREGRGFGVATTRRCWRANSVIIATGAHHTPSIPRLADQLDLGVVQLHSSTFRGPTQLPAGQVLVIGAGNSGAEIALDLATDPTTKREVHLAGRDVGYIPNLGPLTFQILQQFGRAGAVLAQQGLRGHGDPLGRIRPGQLEATGVQRHPRVTGVRDGMPLLANGRVLSVAAVIWCTGSRPDYRWLQLDVLNTAGHLRHRGGVVQGSPGLYTVGLPYQRSITSHLLGGVGTDAHHVAKKLLTRAAPR